MDTRSHVLMEILKWVTDVAVCVDATPTALARSLETEVDQKLRHAGIAVVSPPTRDEFRAKRTLRVMVAVTPSTTDINQSSLHTQLKLTAWIVPVCGGSRGAETPIWWGKRAQVVSNVDVETRLRQDIESLIDEFVAAYRSARQPS